MEKMLPGKKCNWNKCHLDEMSLGRNATRINCLRKKCPRKKCHYEKLTINVLITIFRTSTMNVYGILRN